MTVIKKKRRSGKSIGAGASGASLDPSGHSLHSSSTSSPLTFTKTLDTETRKQWLSECGNYRIDYYNSFPYLASYKPAYYASVRMVHSGRTVWAFAHKHGKFNSYSTAEKACRTNRFKWRRYLKAKDAEEARSLIEKSIVGMGRKANGDRLRTYQTTKILSSIPAWVEVRIKRRLHRLLPGAGPPRRKKCAGLNLTSALHTASPSSGHIKQLSQTTERSPKRTGTTSTRSVRSPQKRRSSVARTPSKTRKSG